MHFVRHARGGGGCCGVQNWTNLRGINWTSDTFHPVLKANVFSYPYFLSFAHCETTLYLPEDAYNNKV